MSDDLTLRDEFALALLSSSSVMRSVGDSHTPEQTREWWGREIYLMADAMVLARSNDELGNLEE